MFSVFVKVVAALYSPLFPHGARDSLLSLSHSPNFLVYKCTIAPYSILNYLHKLANMLQYKHGRHWSLFVRLYA